MVSYFLIAKGHSWTLYINISQYNSLYDCKQMLTNPYVLPPNLNPFPIKCKTPLFYPKLVYFWHKSVISSSHKFLSLPQNLWIRGKCTKISKHVKLLIIWIDPLNTCGTRMTCFTLCVMLFFFLFFLLILDWYWWCCWSFKMKGRGLVSTTKW